MDFLQELGISSENSGAYDGTWLPCEGELLDSVSPATGARSWRTSTRPHA